MLPNETYSIKECTIRKMTISEQKRRKFSPINIEVKEITPSSFYKSYVGFGVLTDTRLFKTEYVIYTDISTNRNDASHVLGVAVRRFDEVIGALSLASSDWFCKTHTRDPIYKATMYQMSKIYELVDDKEVSFGQYNLYRGGGSQINLPDAKASFDKIDFTLITRVLNNKDKVFSKSLKYLLSAEDGIYKGLPPEKIILDLMKSIEVIVTSFPKKRTKKKEGVFRARLKKCAEEIGLTEKQNDQIMQLWKDRSNGDIAHSTSSSRSDYLPPQYPIPSDVVFIPFQSDLAVQVLLKYLEYKKGEILVEISNDPFHTAGSLIDVNFGSYYIYTPKKSEKRVAHFVKKAIASYFKIAYRKITIRKSDLINNTFLFKIQ